MLVQHTGAKTAAPVGCDIDTASVQLRHGQSLGLGGQTLTALHTLGHTASSMSHVRQNHVVTGNALLIKYRSLTKVLFALQDATTVWSGYGCHDRTHSSIGIEKANNARIAGKTLAECIAVMNNFQLLQPARIHDADAQGATVSSDTVRPATGYAGDVSASLAYQWWQAGAAVLVDVRSDAEREWVGFVPGAVALAWKQWPGMAMNPGFDDALRAVVYPGQKALLFCRSGVRSIAAAKRATELGIEAYNILEGFEGDLDEQAHRGSKGGWRKQGLPWRQN